MTTNMDYTKIMTLFGVLNALVHSFGTVDDDGYNSFKEPENKKAATECLKEAKSVLKALEEDYKRWKNETD